MSITWGKGANHGGKPVCYWKRVPCPNCHATVGQNCMIPTISMRPYHAERNAAYIAERQRKRMEEIRAY